MTDNEMLVSIFALLCGTGVMIAFILALRSLILARLRGPSTSMVDEIRGLREEVSRLRSENHDVILSFDASIQKMDRRLEYLEGTRSLGSGTSHHPEVEEATVARTRR